MATKNGLCVKRTRHDAFSFPVFMSLFKMLFPPETEGAGSRALRQLLSTQNQLHIPEKLWRNQLSEILHVFLLADLSLIRMNF